MDHAQVFHFIKPSEQATIGSITLLSNRNAVSGSPHSGCYKDHRGEKTVLCVLEGFHNQDLMVAVGFLGSLVMF